MLHPLNSGFFLSSEKVFSLKAGTEQADHLLFLLTESEVKDFLGFQIGKKANLQDKQNPLISIFYDGNGESSLAERAMAAFKTISKFLHAKVPECTLRAPTFTWLQ